VLKDLWERSMPALRTVAVAGVLCLLLVPQSGCVVAACGAGAAAGIAYVGGASVMMLEGSPQQVQQAAEESLGQLCIATISSRTTNNGAEVIGRNQCDDKVTICIRQCRSNSEVSVRVGLWGNRYAQNNILSTISQNLRSCPPDCGPSDAPPPSEAPAPESQPANESGG
jgi:hypothetical protein